MIVRALHEALLWASEIDLRYSFIYVLVWEVLVDYSRYWRTISTYFHSYGLVGLGVRMGVLFKSCFISQKIQILAFIWFGSLTLWFGYCFFLKAIWWFLDSAEICDVTTKAPVPFLLCALHSPYLSGRAFALWWNNLVPEYNRTWVVVVIFSSIGYYRVLNCFSPENIV